MLITILIGLAALSVLVLVHELGHFFSAKAVGVRVEEFGLGYPPRLLSFKRGETRYSLNAIPFGGFNRLTGEENPNQPRSLASKSIAARLLVLSAGSLMNLLLPFLLFTIIFIIPHDVIIGQVTVKEVALDSPAAVAGIKPGDIILSINEKPVQSSSELSRNIQVNLGEETAILVQHSDSTTESFQVIPRWQPPAGQGAIGVIITTSNPVVTTEQYPFWEAIPLGASACIETFVLYIRSIISTITGAVPAEMAGPVSIVQLTGEVGKAGISPLLEITAFISIAIAITQFLPIPALDGGRIMFVLLEWVRRGKRISPKTEGRIHAIGFILLITAMLAITYQDILRIISGKSLIP